MRVFSGIRASGDKTLGNYSGGFRQYVATQEQVAGSGGEGGARVVSGVLADDSALDNSPAV